MSEQNSSPNNQLDPVHGADGETANKGGDSSDVDETSGNSAIRRHEYQDFNEYDLSTMDQDSEELDLNHGRMDKIDGLERFANLQKICYRQNLLTKIENVHPVAASLVELDFYDNQIAKIENLEMLVNLEHLDLSFNRIRKIENLSTLTRLKRLYLVHNKIDKIENLDQLVDLELLELGDNRLRKIENLEKLTKLRELYFGKNKITKLEGLGMLVNLELLSVQSNRITKLEGLDSLTNLQQLYASENGIQEIEGFQNTTQLTTLDLANNQITKLANLKQLSELEDFWIWTIGRINMEPDFNGISIIEDVFDGSAQSLMIAYAKKFIKRSYRIVCLVDGDRMISLIRKALGDEGIDIHRIDMDPLGWDTENGDVTSNCILGNVNTLISVTQRWIGDNISNQKTVLLVPSFSFVWITLGHVDAMRFMMRIRFNAVIGESPSTASLPLIAIINSRFLTVSQRDQLKHISSSWISTSKDGSKSESTLCRIRIQHCQKKGAKFNQKNVTLDVTNAFDIVTASSKPTKASEQSKAQPSQDDPTVGLTFNLMLKETEAMAKRNVQLPHLVVRDNIKKQIGIDVQPIASKTGGQIYYTPDEADDFDEEDPDADLDI